MGVDGFLRQVKEALEDSHLRAFSGHTLAVDASSWMHKAYVLRGSPPCKSTDSYVRYMVRKAQLVRACGVREVVLVFDGQRLPLKAATHKKRQGAKEENRRIAMQLMRDAEKVHGEARSAEIAKAYQHFQRAVSITQTIVANVMDALRANGIPFVVAPFEADAQLVWMCKTGAASGIVTEDSDVFLYCIASGVDAPVLFKLDDSGSGVRDASNGVNGFFFLVANPFMKKLFHLTTGEKEATRMFIQFCVLSGCDFLDSLPNMGIVTALKHVFNFRGAPAQLRVQRILSKLASGGAAVPPGFLDRFVLAESIFYHHIVFNADARACELLVDGSHRNCHRDVFERALESLGIPPAAVDPPGGLLLASATLTSSFLGAVPAPELARGIHDGSICPRTLRSVSEAHAETDAFRPPPAALEPRRSDDADDADADDATSTLSAAASDAPRPRPRQEAKPPTPAELERRVAGHEKQRDATLKRLLSVYAKPPAAELGAASSASVLSPLASTTRGDAASAPDAAGASWLLKRVAATPSDSSGSAKKRKLADDSGPSSGRYTAVTSFQDLVSKNRADAVVSQRNAPRLANPTASTRQQRATTASLAGKRAKAAGKGKEANGSTLLQFFQRS
ncbi:hypothetical protein PybrP1_001502 [[Pythium] brassicae (nom. inval.)]|nr:hypothetical protein PybrP1_001502 [[Pythium] brassicae (nom. inval.)]